VAISWTQETFERVYRTPEGVGFTRNFYRRFAGEPATPDGDHGKWWRALLSQRIEPVFAGKITGAQRLLVVGCGLGILVEELISLGLNNTWGIDSSPYCASRWTPELMPTSLIPRLAQLDVRTATAQQIRNLTGGTTFDWVITESVMEGYAPEEQAELYDACEALLQRQATPDRCVHIVYENTDLTRWPNGQIPQPDGPAIPEPWAGQPIVPPGCPPRTMAEWRASRPNHTFISMIGVS
jgi:hypothetical protein